MSYLYIPRQYQPHRVPLHFTKAEMVAEARARGFKVTERMFQDWVDRNLIDHPERHGLGHEGSTSWWSPGQMDIWLGLLQLKQEGEPDWALYDYPVHSWLFAGDTRGVSLQQVQRLMESWVETQQPPMVEGTKEAVRVLIDRIASPRSSGKRRVAKELTERFYSVEGFQLEELFLLLSQLLDRPDPNKGDDTTEVVKRAKVLYALLYSGDLIARQDALRHIKEIPDPLWQLARVITLMNIAIRQYGNHILETTLERGRVTLHIPSGYGARLTRLILLGGLGFAHLYAQADAQTKRAIPLILHPDAWQAGERTVAIKSHIEYSSLWVPFDPPTRYISITLTFSHHLARSQDRV